MLQGWSRKNNPQVKVLTTVPRDPWHQAVVSYTVSLGNQVTSQSIETLPLHTELCRGDRALPQLIVEIIIDTLNLNEIMCEEVFGGELDVTQNPEDIILKKSHARQHREWLHDGHKELAMLQKMEMAQKTMESSSRTKKNIFLLIRDGIEEALSDMKNLRREMLWSDS